MVSIRILKSTSLAIRVIEETLAYLDPYNHDFPVAQTTPSIQHCEFPEEVEDPFALIRLLRGETYAKHLEYEDHLEIILHVLSTCLDEESKRKGLTTLDDYSTSDDDCAVCCQSTP